MKRFFVLFLAACGSSSSGGTPPADGGQVDAPVGNDAAGGGAGTCLSPRDVTLDFHEAAGATTKNLLDVTAVECGAPTALPEMVYRLVLTDAVTVNLTATDASGQGVGVQVREDSCTGTTVVCDWKSNGDLTRSYPLTAGTWFFVLERQPAGAFTLALTK